MAAWRRYTGRCREVVTLAAAVLAASLIVVVVWMGRR